MNEQKKYEVIKKLKETNGNKKRAAVKLDCAVRHVNRILKGYEELKASILLLYENKYYNSSITHFTEMLAENEDIKVSEQKSSVQKHENRKVRIFRL